MQFFIFIFAELAKLLLFALDLNHNLFDLILSLLALIINLLCVVALCTKLLRLILRRAWLKLFLKLLNFRINVFNRFLYFFWFKFKSIDIILNLFVLLRAFFERISKSLQHRIVCFNLFLI